MTNPLKSLDTSDESKIEFASFKYTHSGNLGDQVQSLAAEQYLPQVDSFINRDLLSEFKSENKTIVITNGWFSHKPERTFPSTEKTVPVFFGFHLSNDKNAAEKILTEENIEYFKTHAPIGCRDLGTKELLESKGIESFYSRCLTQTFEKRHKDPQHGKILVVDAKYVPMPLKIRNKAEFITQICTDIYDNAAKREMARSLLNYYKENASLIITTRIHCAMPCVAMGIPVIYFGNPKDYRTSLVKDLGLAVNPYVKSKEFFYRRLLKISPYLHSDLHDKSIDWTPKALNIEEIKINIKESLFNQIEYTLNRHKIKYKSSKQALDFVDCLSGSEVIKTVTASSSSGPYAEPHS